MNRIGWILAAVGAGLLVSAHAPAADSSTKAQQLKCDIGPLARTYGGTQWNVLSCDDGRTVVIISAPGNPGAPFYFMFSPTMSGYRLTGEGSGNRDATKAAFEELRGLSERDVLSLVDLTRQR